MCDHTLFRGNNNIYKTAEFRAELKNYDQKTTFCVVGAHHQHVTAESYIKTMVEKVPIALLNLHTRWPSLIQMEL